MGNDGMFRAAAASFPLVVANPAANAQQIVLAAQRATEQEAGLLLTAELSLTGCTCGHLFYQPSLLQSALDALVALGRATTNLPLLLVVGLPLRHQGKLCSCAAFLQKGQLLGLVPKTSPTHGIFTGEKWIAGEAELPHFGAVPFGENLRLRCVQEPNLCLAVTVGEWLDALPPPATTHAMGGATLLLFLGAENETATSAAFRKQQLAAQSAQLACATLYAGAGGGESTTDKVFSGHQLLYENGQLLAEAPPFSDEMAIADIDTGLLAQERRRREAFPPELSGYRDISFTALAPPTSLLRTISPTPFLPNHPAEATRHSETILSIQANGLCKRLTHTGLAQLVLGISGGLDSTLALLVAVRTMQLLQRPMADILAVTMPGFGTTPRTRSNAEALCHALGVTLKTVDITASVRAHFVDIGQNEATKDVTYENAQARMRTMVLMDLANQGSGLVVGTGDLSELALGWATYNGDHMSMYGVNAGVPKTLVRHLVQYEARRNPSLATVLGDILNTPVSPELLPACGGEISQQTEALVGPYTLHDFFLYHLLHHAASPTKLYRFACHAFAGQYEETKILHWLTVFFTRFISQQFKRSCLPDGPQVLSVGLSPRGAWAMPSDASAATFLEELKALAPKE